MRYAYQKLVHSTRKCLRRLINAIRRTPERQSYALNELDKRIEPFLKIRKGFFIEVGANDGISQSNTLYFEKYHGWTGLLIEAIPELAQRCRDNRPHCLVENCALVASDYQEDTVEMVYCNLMSVVQGAMEDRKQQEHIRIGQQHLKEEDQVYKTEVPARTLSTVLDQYGIEQIDLLSLDVEGYEAQVLRGLDFDRHCPRYMLIEVRDKELIESIIARYYKPIAALSINPSYSDMLYCRK